MTAQSGRAEAVELRSTGQPGAACPHMFCFAGGGMRWSVVVVLVLASTVAVAQESFLHADFRRETERKG